MHLICLVVLGALAPAAALVVPTAPAHGRVPSLAAASRAPVAPIMAAAADDFVPDLQRRTIMNLVLLGGAGVPVLWMGGGFIYFFVPPAAGGGGGGLIAKDALGDAVKVADWISAHPYPTRSLVQGLKGDAHYLVVKEDKTLENYAINAVCTHLGCVVPWNVAANKCAPCRFPPPSPRTRAPDSARPTSDARSRLAGTNAHATARSTTRPARSFAVRRRCRSLSHTATMSRARPASRRGRRRTSAPTRRPGGSRERVLPAVGAGLQRASRATEWLWDAGGPSPRSTDTARRGCGFANRNDSLGHGAWRRPAGRDEKGVGEANRLQPRTSFGGRGREGGVGLGRRERCLLLTLKSSKRRTRARAWTESCILDMTYDFCDFREVCARSGRRGRGCTVCAMLGGDKGGDAREVY